MPEGSDQVKGKPVKMVWAVVRWTVLKEIERGLFEIGERSFSVTKVRGFEIVGNLNSESDLVDHLEITLVTQESRVGKIKAIILSGARTGNPGDGVIAVLPVEEFQRIRDAKEI